MATKQPITWINQPVKCKHSPNGFHHLNLGMLGDQVIYLSCECGIEHGTAFCAVEHEMTEEYYSCYAAMIHTRNLLRNSYTSGARKKNLEGAKADLRGHLASTWDGEHYFVNLVVGLYESALRVRSEKVRPYTQYRPLSYNTRKAFLLEKFVRRHLGAAGPMFHVHPHEDESQKLVLLLGTTKILTCGLDLKSNRRHHQSWTRQEHKYHHSNANSNYCLFCERTYFNMGSHTLGQPHIKRVAAAVNKARRVMSREGLAGAHE